MEEVSERASEKMKTTDDVDDDDGEGLTVLKNHHFANSLCYAQT